MSELRIIGNSLPSMNKEAIYKVKVFESEVSKLPQIDIATSHIIHGGMYARTILIPAGAVLTGALIKIATILIVQGHAIVYIGNDSVEMSGYNVLPASANRKQAFFAKADTYLTMIFPSGAKDIDTAEMEFTDEINLLISRKGLSSNEIIITGE